MFFQKKKPVSSHFLVLMYPFKWKNLNEARQSFLDVAIIRVILSTVLPVCECLFTQTCQVNVKEIVYLLSGLRESFMDGKADEVVLAHR